MVYKTISSKSIIARVFRDLKPATGDWVGDAVEWLGEAVERIGYFHTREIKTVELTSCDFKIPYPCDLDTVEHITYNACPLGWAGGNSAITKDVRTVFRYQGNYYITGDSCLKLSDEKMKITLTYSAFPLDEDSYPLIPDNFYYKTACFWLIAARLAMREEHKRFTYEYCEERFNTYSQLAENDCAFPSVDRMQSFQERWCRLVPNVAANVFAYNHQASTWLEIAP